MKYNHLKKLCFILSVLIISLSVASCRKLDESVSKTDIDSTYFSSEAATETDAPSPETSAQTTEAEDQTTNNVSTETQEIAPETFIKEPEPQETKNIPVFSGSSTPSTSAPEPEDDIIPDEFSNHVFVQSKNIGNCYEFKGNVLLTFVFLNDSVSSWDTVSENNAKGVIDAELSKVKSDADAYGVNLSMTTVYKNASIDLNTGMGSSTNNWRNAALTAAGLPALYSLNTDIVKANSNINTDEAPVIFLLNKNGRAFANTSDYVDSGEYIVLFNDTSALRHELYHLFGANDYYYTSEMRDITKKYFGECVMLGGRSGEIDSLSAFLMGWTNNLDTAAIGFLRATSHFTQEYIDQANRDDSITGYGTLTFDNGTYTGDLVEGVEHGYGKYVFNSGGVYEGDYVFGVKEGEGTYTWEDGTYYTGEWLNGDMTGQGTQTYSDGSFYTGDFLADKRHGQGTYTFENGDKYIGGWIDNEKSGYGTYTWADGTVYTGYWKDNLMHGEGSMTFPSGYGMSGTWENDKFIG